jgi:ABC-type glycerol-3-phosphate transport system permease component
MFPQMGHSSASRNVVTIELNQPIRAARPFNLLLLLAGLLLALHPIAWILLLHYRDRREIFEDKSARVLLLDTLSHAILDVTPAVTSKVLTFFLASFCLFVGMTSLSIKR